MRTIIAGTRLIDDYDELCRVVNESGIIPSVIISGTAIGPDRNGERYGFEHNIPVERFPADWSKGRGAGVIRNIAMLEIGKADALIAQWDGKSAGTKHMIESARSRGLIVYVQKYKIILQRDK